jgi:protease-4
MAGSGGYWVAASADAIIADPATLTGSIGVIAGKVAATDEMWDKIGVHWGMITRGENADLLTITQPFTDAQRAKVDAMVGETYQSFKRHVADARDLSDEEVAVIAKGRVWTGNQAVNLGLVDELGGLFDAVQYTKNVIGLTEDDSVLMKIFPAPESFAERITKMLEQFGGLGVSMGKLGVVMKTLEPVLSPLLSMTASRPRDLRMQGLEGLR